MPKTRWIAIPMALLLACTLAACWSSTPATQSGLPADTHVGDLAAPQQEDLCLWGVQIGAVDVGEFDCTVEIVESPTLDECRAFFAEPPPCDPTVAQVEACWRAMAADACGNYHAAVCNPPGCE